MMVVVVVPVFAHLQRPVAYLSACSANTDVSYTNVLVKFPLLTFQSLPVT